MYAYINASAIGFVKFSDTSWRVYSGKHMIEVADGVGDYPNTAWTANVDARWNSELQGLDILFADCTVTYSSGPANPSVLFNGTATPDTTGDKDVVLVAEGGNEDDGETPEPPTDEGAPDTGDMGIAVSAVALVAACASVAVIRRRKHNV